jgi:hypothetical protein
MISKHDETAVGQKQQSDGPAPVLESMVNKIPEKLAGLSNTACLQEAVRTKSSQD